MIATIHHGNCIEVLKTLEANSVDSVVTDPPAGIHFMNKKWDHDLGGRAQWIAWMTDVMRECLRVLKPGGHALVWALPRTSHWTGMAIEDAGFEIRDQISHIFGTGFPKSLDVSKAIDNVVGAKRQVIGKSKTCIGPSMAKTRTSQIDVEGNHWQTANVVTAPATNAAKQWDGWGTALKPAAEHWWLCRKPLAEKTVAANMLAHGTGALNIDGCRIVHANADDLSDSLAKNPGRTDLANSGVYGANRPQQTVNIAGRWPANVALSHSGECDESCANGCPIRMLDEQSGMLKSSAWNGRRNKSKTKNTFGQFTVRPEKPIAGSLGGASRFFYCSKASPKDREEGLDAFAATNVNDGRNTSIDNAYQRGDTKRRNTHPTVKSTDLMRWLVRLVTPPGGIVLDPFCGSGSTGKACALEGFKFIGIEQNEEYFAIAKARIDFALRKNNRNIKQINA